ncbi:siderophore-interacting protein [Cellulomonas sp. SLBN-39]|uniref:siderophore-interacting protein n=1 Tax=Cellulomonas sp. SLBN-39 TaxID=2768446 RepID=UPI001151C114|nr:siderophore-interacting protein [Cellulomonas sp. SLBN-39]TQL02174.1 NADPH-dependent ferric siderophore reductase [Cellulomonas sp. SLBN-39]
MARQQLARVKPETSRSLTLEVLRTTRVSPAFARVTLGGGDVEHFRPLGFDQWFRLFLPVSADSLDHVPDRLDTFTYLRHLMTSSTSRPVIRSYTVRAYRPDGPSGPEIDVDLVLHGSAEDGTAGPAATWASTCRAGDHVAIIDEGILFVPPAGTTHVTLVADETALPAVAGVLASLDADAVGTAVVEVPHADDRQDLDAPVGVDVRWLVRGDDPRPPGSLALDHVRASTTAPGPTWYGWAAGESTLATGARRHWVSTGASRDQITFCGYWKHRTRH